MEDDPRETEYAPALLDGIACDISARPHGAPYFAHVAGGLRAVHRAGNALLVDYDPAVADVLMAVVEAERRCCADIGWHLDRVFTGNPRNEVQRLRVEATPTQLDTVTLLFDAPAVRTKGTETTETSEAVS